MAEFFEMGGYATFVWTAYGLSAAALVWLAFSSRKRQRDTDRSVAAMRARRKGKA